MALWVCKRCRTAYAVGLTMCPQCTSEEVWKEDEVPKTTVHGGASYKEGEAPEEVAGADVPQDEPQAVEDAPGPEGLDALTKAELQDLLDEKGLPVSGNKAELAQRLRDYADEEAATEEDPDTSEDGA